MTNQSKNNIIKTVPFRLSKGLHRVRSRHPVSVGAFMAHRHELQINRNELPPLAHQARGAKNRCSPSSASRTHQSPKSQKERTRTRSFLPTHVRVSRKNYFPPRLVLLAAEKVRRGNASASPLRRPFHWKNYFGALIFAASPSLSYNACIALSG